MSSTSTEMLVQAKYRFRRRRRRDAFCIPSTNATFPMMPTNCRLKDAQRRKSWNAAPEDRRSEARKYSLSTSFQSRFTMFQFLWLLVFTLVSVGGQHSIPEQYTPCLALLAQADRNRDFLLSDLEFLAAIRLLAGGGVLDASTKVKLSSELQASLGSGGVPYTDPVFTEMLCTAIYDGIILAALGSELTPLACSSAYLLGDRNRDDLLSRGEEFSRFASRLSNGIYPLATTFESLPYVVQKIFDIFSTGDEIDIYGSKSSHRDATDEQIRFTFNLCRQTTVAIVLVQNGMDPGSPDNSNPSPSATTQPTSPQTSNTNDTKAPTRTPTPPKDFFSFTFQECQRAIALSDMARNNFLDENEFVRFVDRLSNSHFSDAANFVGLPQLLQDVYKDLATNNGDGQRISVAGGKPGSTPSAEQLQSIQHICQSTLDAMNASVHSWGSTTEPSTYTMSPTSIPETLGPMPTVPDEIVVDMDRCKQEMIASDLSRDSRLNEQEYVRFLSRNSNSVSLNDSFASIPEILRETFYSLAAMTDEPETINVEGARRGSVVSDAQEAYLEYVCRETLRVISLTQQPVSIVPTRSPTFVATLTPSHEPTALSEEPTAVTDKPAEIISEPTNQPTESVDTPTEQPSEAPAEDRETVLVYNAFLISDSAGDPASSMVSGRNRIALDLSYAKFVRYVFENFSTTSQNGRLRWLRHDSHITRRGRVFRRLGVESLNQESIELFDIVDSECPEQVIDRSWSCMSVYGAFEVTYRDDSIRYIFQEYAQEALIQNDLLQSLLEETDSEVTISVIGSAGIKEKPGEQTLPPSEEPATPPQEPGGGKSNAGFIAMIAALGVVGAGGGLCILRRYRETIQKCRGWTPSKRAPSDKTTGDGSDGEDAEMAPVRRNKYGFEENSDCDQDDLKQLESDLDGVKQLGNDLGIVKQLDHDPFAANESDPWKSPGVDWSKEELFEVDDVVKSDGGSRSYDDEESGTGTESYNEPDDFTRESLSKAGGTLLAENMHNLDTLVNQGDWDGVMKAASNFESHFDDFSIPSNEIDDLENELEDASEGSSVVDEMSDYGGDFEEDEKRLSLTSQDLRRRDQYRKQIETLVKQCVPDELDNISAMMDQFSGREVELINTLQSMSERVTSQRARNALNKSKPIAGRETRALPHSARKGAQNRSTKPDNKGRVAHRGSGNGHSRSSSGKGRRTDIEKRGRDSDNSEDEDSENFSQDLSASHGSGSESYDGEEQEERFSDQVSMGDEESQGRYSDEGSNAGDEHDDASGSGDRSGSYESDGFDERNSDFLDEDEASATGSDDEDPEEDFGDEESYADGDEYDRETSSRDRRRETKSLRDEEGSYYSNEEDEAERSHTSGSYGREDEEEEQGSYYSEDDSRRGSGEGSYYSDGGRNERRSSGSYGSGKDSRSREGSHRSGKDGRSVGEDEGSYFSGERSRSDHDDKDSNYSREKSSHSGDEKGSFISGRSSRRGQDEEGSYYSGKGSRREHEEEGSYYSETGSRGEHDDEGSSYSDEDSRVGHEDEGSHYSGGDNGSRHEDGGSYDSDIISHEEEGSYYSRTGNSKGTDEEGSYYSKGGSHRRDDEEGSYDSDGGSRSDDEEGSSHSRERSYTSQQADEREEGSQYSREVGGSYVSGDGTGSFESGSTHSYR